MKGLKSLEKIKHTTDLGNPLYGWTNELNFIEKELKALEIIKNKKVNIRLITLCQCVDDYNYIEDNEELTQEEFDLVKEVLMND